MSKTPIIIGGIVVVVLIVLGIMLYMTMGKESPSTTGPGPSPGPAPPSGPGGSGGSPSTPCAGLTDTSLASSIPVSCLRKILTDEGCTSSGTIWPQDDYNGWWRQNDGAGNFATVKSDIHAWATMTDALRVAGCGRVPQYYLGDAGCTADESGPKDACRNNALCTAVAQQPNGCWHTLQNQGSDLKDLTGYSKIILKKDT